MGKVDDKKVLISKRFNWRLVGVSNTFQIKNQYNSKKNICVKQTFFF